VIRGLFCDLARHLERAWVAYTGADPYLGDVWEVALLDLQPNGSRRWPATEGAIDFGVIELVWLREVAKDWARATRPYLQRIREALRACRVASEALVVAGRTDPTSLGAGDFALVVGAISTQRRSDGQLYSAAHRNLLLYMIREVLEHGRANGLMAQVPDPFGRGRAQRVVEDPNEEQLGKALPESVIRQLDAHIGLLGPDGRSGSIAAVDLQAMQQTIYALLRDTGRRPGEVVSLKVGCIETIDGHHNLVYDNHKAARKRRRLPVTTETAAAVAAWERRRAELGDPPLTQGWLFPSPLLRARQSVGHLTASCVARAFKVWAARIPIIEGELIGPDATPVPFARTLIVPYALRHCYVSHLTENGVDRRFLQEQVGHRCDTSTAIYTHVGNDFMNTALRKALAPAFSETDRKEPS
jgi:integrase